tara:strand:+ start:1163 stop:1309 length:147 start_codon:yes stop_codon:yes gene_type:complete
MGTYSKKQVKLTNNSPVKNTEEKFDMEKYVSSVKKIKPLTIKGYTKAF